MAKNRKVVSFILSVLMIFSSFACCFTVYAAQIEHVFAINDQDIRMPLNSGSIDFDQSGGCETMSGYGLFVPTDKLDITGKNLTLALYISFRDDNNGNPYDIISKGNTQYGIRFYPESEQLEFYLYDSAQPASERRQSVKWTIPAEYADNWYDDNIFRKVVATYDGTDMKLYFAPERNVTADLVASQKADISITSNEFQLGINENAESGTQALNAITFAIVASESFTPDEIDLSYAICADTGYGTVPTEYTMFFLPISACFGMFEEYHPDTPPVIDFQELNELIAQSNAVDSSKYTQSSYSVLKSALEDAIRTADKPSPTQNEINAACASLKSALNALVKLADTTNLKKLIAEAAAIDQNKYTTASYNVLKDALKDAREIVNDQDLTSDILKPIETALSNAIKNLVPLADKSTLERLIVTAKSITNEDDYASASYLKLQDMIKAGEDVLTLPEATSAQISTAEKNLQSAMDGLVSLLPIKEALKRADAITDGSLYTEESYAAFQEALSAAKDILNKANATTKEVTDCSVALNAAISGLKLNIDSDVSVPASAHVNEAFHIVVKLNPSYTNLMLVNEIGRQVSITDVAVENIDGVNVWTVATKVGTAGEGRTISIFAKVPGGDYVDTGLSATLNIVKPPDAGNTLAKIKSASFSTTTAKKNEMFTITARTTANTGSVRLYNENASNIGMKLVSKTQVGSTTTFIYSLSVGTAGVRSFAAVAVNQYGIANINTPYKIPMIITK